MKPSDFQKTVQCRFESCLKKVVRHVVKDYQQGLKRRKEKEVSFCELQKSSLKSWLFGTNMKAIIQLLKCAVLRFVSLMTNYQ